MRNFLAKVDMGVICNSCNYIACTLKMWHEAGYMQLGNIKVAGTVGKTSCPIAPCSCVKYSEGKVCTSTVEPVSVYAFQQSCQSWSHILYSFVASLAANTLTNAMSLS